MSPLMPIRPRHVTRCYFDGEQQKHFSKPVSTAPSDAEALRHELPNFSGRQFIFMMPPHARRRIARDDDDDYFISRRFRPLLYRRCRDGAGLYCFSLHFAASHMHSHVAFAFRSHVGYRVLCRQPAPGSEEILQGYVTGRLRRSSGRSPA